MQRMTYWLQRNSTHLSKPLKTLNTTKSLRGFLSVPSIKRLDAYQIPPAKRFSKTKKFAQLSSIALLSLPAQSITLTTTQGSDHAAYDKVQSSNTLVVASVKGDSTFFSTDGFQHGFGYDLARTYAQQLGVEIKVIDFENDAKALKAVNLGQADMALTTASTRDTENAGLSAMNVSCGYDQSLVNNGLHPKTNWSFKNGTDPLAIEASHFLCANDQLVRTAKLADFYDQNLLKDDYNREHFEKSLNTNLPSYKTSFQEQANNYDHDWQLLVAMGYQESHLDANAVSPTGVRGLMMLTNSTAKAMGVSNRVDPYQSIGGGARYLEQMKATFSDVPNPDRLWFALASYNMGPNAVKKIQRKLETKGLNPNSWANVYSYLSNNASSNSRYIQCMHYVTNIRSYLELLKTRSTELT